MFVQEGKKGTAACSQVRQVCWDASVRSMLKRGKVKRHVRLREGARPLRTGTVKPMSRPFRQARMAQLPRRTPAAVLLPAVSPARPSGCLESARCPRPSARRNTNAVVEGDNVF